MAFSGENPSDTSADFGPLMDMLKDMLSALTAKHAKVGTDVSPPVTTEKPQNANEIPSNKGTIIKIIKV